MSGSSINEKDQAKILEILNAQSKTLFFTKSSQRISWDEPGENFDYGKETVSVQGRFVNERNVTFLKTVFRKIGGTKMWSCHCSTNTNYVEMVDEHEILTVIREFREKRLFCGNKISI